MSARSPVTTHVLDLADGRPAAGIDVRLESLDDGAVLGRGTTDADGRVGDLVDGAIAPGAYRLVFDTGAWFAAREQETFYPRVEVLFRVEAAREHYHVPLLLSPWGYSTYRGS